LLLVAFLLGNAPICHLSLVLASVVQGDAVNCNTKKGAKQSFALPFGNCDKGPKFLPKLKSRA